MMRVCTEPGCPTLINQGTRDGRCTQHQHTHNKARGTTTQRGYGTQHQTLRKQLTPQVATGTTTCARCGQPITPNQPWDLGHHDTNRNTYQGPEHVHCNRATATHRTNQTPGG